MKKDIIFEEALSDEWAGDLDVMEVPLGEKSLWYVGAAVLLVAAVVFGRIVFFGMARGEFYGQRAGANLSDEEWTVAPRGIVEDRFGSVLAQSHPVFSAVLDLKEFLHREELRPETLKAVEDVLGLAPDEVWQLVEERNQAESSEPIILYVNLDQGQLVVLKELDLPTLKVANSFEREYKDGPVFSSLLGYIGLPDADDLKNTPGLSGQDFVGRTGLEAFYDDELRGKPGIVVKLRDARGKVLGEEKKSDPEAGQTLTLTVDAEFQSFFYRRMQEGLAALGRTAGVGLAINPQNGEVLALLSFPSYDNNLFGSRGRSAERQALLDDNNRPLFNRAVAGLYAPGSTIKPLVAVAALSEGVIQPERSIFSPGYLDVPNPFDPERPTRFLDWRYQGHVDLSAAIAQSANVYFYLVGGGSPSGIAPEILDGGGRIRGLGIGRLSGWWRRFGLGVKTGIDLPGEEKGFLPSAEWKEKRDGRPWLLGDTYNVSIGQGDLLVTPLQLLSYIAAVANGGNVHKPVINKNAPQPEVLADLSYLGQELAEVGRGMREAVTSPLGTANRMADLPLAVAGKTGSAQILNNAEENAFFVGYAPADNPQIAVLVLVEKAVQGSLNAVPIAKDVLEWYYWNRIKNHKS